jgi:hypothetical protein
MSEIVVHALLLGGDVLATLAVGWGILWEGPRQSANRHRIAEWLVIVGIAAETVSSISLFVYDESISNAQQDKIIALEARLAARALSAADALSITDVVKRFAGQSLKIAPYVEDTESSDFGEQIAAALIKGQWSGYKPQGTSAMLGVVAL